MGMYLDVYPTRPGEGDARPEIAPDGTHPGWSNVKQDPSETLTDMGIDPGPGLHNSCGGECDAVELLSRASAPISEDQTDEEMLDMFREVAQWAVNNGWPLIAWSYC
jgi:hypothetical protein